MASGRSTHTPEMLFSQNCTVVALHTFYLPETLNASIFQDNRAIHFHALGIGT